MTDMETDAGIRRRIVSGCSRVVVKAGTRLLADREAVGRLVEGISAIREGGRKVLLVSSGAVGMGMRELRLKSRPRELDKVQALAAVGQSRLMAIYDDECSRHGFASAQLLLTRGDLGNRRRYLNVMNCINALWECGALPVVNENDPVSTDELKFGDNDTLAGSLASLTDAELTVILTTESGLRRRNDDGKLAERISVVRNLTPALRKMAGGTDDSSMSIGGMESKLRAADIINAGGGALWIADGREPGILEQIFSGADVGTLFLPRKGKMPGRKRWLRFFARVSGTLVVDAGAADAIISGGRSLLASGLCGISGGFKRGDTVEIAGPDGIPFARGMVNFSADECLLVRGCRTEKLHNVLGADADDEVVHRNNLTLLQAAP